MDGGEDFTHGDKVAGEGWTERGGGAHCGAGVKCSMERRAPMW